MPAAADESRLTRGWMGLVAARRQDPAGAPGPSKQRPAPNAIGPVEHAMTPDEPAALSNAGELGGCHQFAREPPLVLEHMVAILALQPRQPPAAEPVSGARPPSPRDLEVEQIRVAIVTHEHLLGLVGVDVGH